CVAGSEIAVILPVAVHHGDAPGARFAAAVFGDVSDARVERSRSAGDRAVRKARTFVGGASPVPCADDEAFARELAALVQVVDVAADRQPPVRAALDEAGNQRLGPLRPPLREGR